ncbi:MAG: hypothetical protein RLZZ22_1049 [Pseudomonadota bacterium]
MALNAAGLSPLRFVPQAELPEGRAYEAHIFDTGDVPTREGLHDFFNALSWMRFPATKQRLNQLQARAIAQAGGFVGTRRGPLRDALTLFDENAALLQAPEPVWQALLARDWSRLFVELRPLWAQSTLLLFGHALTEKLVAPYKSITAHVLRLPVPTDWPAEEWDRQPDEGVGLLRGGSAAVVHPWDDWLAGQLTPEWLATKPYTPLPVLGTPGWWPANEDPAFYADAQVFRPARIRSVRAP